MNVLSTLWHAWNRFACWGVARPNILRVVVIAQFEDPMLSVITSIAASVFYYFHYDFVRQNLVYLSILCGWILVTIFNYALTFKIVPRLKQTDEHKIPSWAEVQNYMGISLLVGTLQSLAVVTIAVAALLKGHDGLNSPGVIGAVFFFIGLVLNGFMSASSVISANTILLAPLLLIFVTRGHSGDMSIAVFLLLLIVAVAAFSQKQRLAFCMQIEQKTQLENLTKALNIEKNRAEEANQAKSHFFTSASHDARQPLQAISLLYESLVRSTNLNVTDRHLVEKIGANLHGIRNLFNRVLDISRIEGGSIQPQMQTITLSELFASLEAQYSEIAAHKNIWLRFSQTDAHIYHDPELLTRMLGNIIHNAIKFTEKGGVWVGYRAQREVIEIRDSGIGIALVEQNNIFQDFYQLHNTERSRDSGAGVGLGLSIVQRMAVLTDTRIDLRSSLGKGTVFRVHCQRVHPVLGVVRDSSEFTATVDSVVDVNGQMRQTTPNLQGVRVLYVEDDAELRALLTHALSERGLDIIACANGRHVRAYVQQHPRTRIDIVLVDYRLPDNETGVEIALWLQHYFKRDIPIVLLTGDTKIHTDETLSSLSKVCVLQKPVQTHDLMEALHTYVK